MMFSTKKHRLLPVLCLLLSAVIMAVCVMTSCSEEEMESWLDSLLNETSQYHNVGDELTGEAHLKMHIIDVGQGDSALIQCGSMNVLIDCGENGLGETVLDYLDSVNVTHLDWLVATHPHSDHIGGMDTVIKSKIKIDHMMMPQVSESMTPTTKTYQDLLDAIEKKKLKITLPSPGKEYDLDGVTMLVLSPAKNAEYSDLNDYSVVLKFTYGDISILTGGDATKKVEKELLAKEYDLQAQILKVFHHGGKESNSQAFINAVNPVYSAISVGEDNSYGHPKEETLQRLESVGSKINRTDTDGTIVYETDGQNIAIMVEK